MMMLPREGESWVERSGVCVQNPVSKSHLCPTRRKFEVVS